jgi:hypothetical protein
MGMKEDYIKDSITDEWYDEHKYQLIEDYLMQFTAGELRDMILESCQEEFIDYFDDDFKEYVEQEREAYQIHQADQERKRC